MKRLISNFFNLSLILLVCLGLSGCVTTNLPFATSSPWDEVELNTESSPLDISFIDSDHGFLVGSNRLIMETTNAGKNWDQRLLDLPDQENFRLISVDFQGSEGWIAGQPGLILHTNDDGKNWTRLSLGNSLPGQPYLITTIGQDSAELATTAGAVYITTNGGLDWEGKVGEAAGGIRDLRRSDNGSYVSASSLGNFYATLEPGAEMWEPHQRASSKRVQTIGYRPDGGLWMLSRGAEIRFNDIDEAENWSKPIIPIVNGYNYLDLEWDPKGAIWASGGNGTLLVSNDQGKNWQQDPIGEIQPSNLIRVLFKPSADKAITRGFVLGERGTLLRWIG